MSFTGWIRWLESPDPERSAYRLLTGYPEGLPLFCVVVQEIGGDAWGWVILKTEGGTPVQMRSGYRSSELAKRGVWEWWRANPNG